ncbi:MAG TPA: metalloregulator ArsR/SmtB family transcription factor [Ignavibacteria bacterium]|nr:metalloregulator ArsR/SmtB family transcription factor [Ignavibacteria bacterium]
MTGREFKNLSYQFIANITNAFSSPKRLEIIDILSQGEKDVDSLTKETNMNFANTSQHLQILKNAKIVQSRKDGVRVIYFLANDEVIRCWKNVQSLAEQNTAELREVIRLFLEEKNIFEPVSIKELRLKMKSNNIILLDVRPKEEYLNGHLPGAVSIPLSELKSKLKNLSGGKEIIAYCRGKYCVMAPEAVNLLNKKGIKSTILQDDINSWRFAGFKIEK